MKTISNIKRIVKTSGVGQKQGWLKARTEEAEVDERRSECPCGAAGLTDRDV